MRIACLEDDPVQASVLKEWLESDEHVCHTFPTAESFVKELRHESYDLLIMDWELPSSSGIELLGWIRNDLELDTPVFFITHRDSEADIVEALEKGADDYLVKPVSKEVTLARVKALARRHTGHSGRKDSLAIGELRLDKETKQVLLAGAPVEMTEKEFQLAWVLLTNVGRLLSRDHLLETIWGFGPELVTRTVDTHISRLRRKLGLVPENGWRLKAIYHQGYRLEQLSSD
jgi:DNA-binding response OmpR family regulator